MGHRISKLYPAGCRLPDRDKPVCLRPRRGHNGRSFPLPPPTGDAERQTLPLIGFGEGAEGLRFAPG